MLRQTDIYQSHRKICSRCIYDERVSSISFDKLGICNYCRQVEDLTEEYGTGKPKGEALFNSIIDQIKFSGRGKKYDCVIGVSGGTDSSYLVHLAKVWGLRPLAVHYDNTWNSAIATMNIHKVLNGLGVDLHTKVVANKEADDIFRSFFLAGVPEIDASTDLGFGYLLRQVAAKYSIKFILEGHSFVEEGITPLGRNYFDGRYIQSIHRTFGHRPMETYPLMTFSRFLKSVLYDRAKFIRPFWYIKYSKSEAKAFLKENFGWEYYGGHHLENRSAAFAYSIYLPEKFGFDLRDNTLAAQVRNGEKTRSAALKEYNTPPVVGSGLLDYVKKRLDLSDDLYEKIMCSTPKSWKDYPTYKKRFERLRLVFQLLAKANLVPMSFYLKYCFRAQDNQ